LRGRQHFPGISVAVVASINSIQLDPAFGQFPEVWVRKAISVASTFFMLAHLLCNAMLLLCSCHKENMAVKRTFFFKFNSHRSDWKLKVI